MGQVTIYLDGEIERKMKNAAKENRLSVSKWIAGVIKEKINNDWPDSVRELPGSWKESEEKELEYRTMPPDIEREEL